MEMLKQIQELLDSATEIPTKLVPTIDHDAVFALLSKGKPVTFKGNDNLFEMVKSVKTCVIQKHKRRVKTKQHTVLGKAIAYTLILEPKE